MPIRSNYWSRARINPQYLLSHSSCLSTANNSPQLPPIYSTSGTRAIPIHNIYWHTVHAYPQQLLFHSSYQPSAAH
jgi:hypothetical protein